jgi:hypothetical protein
VTALYVRLRLNMHVPAREQHHSTCSIRVAADSFDGIGGRLVAGSYSSNRRPNDMGMALGSVMAGMAVTSL